MKLPFRDRRTLLGLRDGGRRNGRRFRRGRRRGRRRRRSPPGPVRRRPGVWRHGGGSKGPYTDRAGHRRRRRRRGSHGRRSPRRRRRVSRGGPPGTRGDARLGPGRRSRAGRRAPRSGRVLIRARRRLKTAPVWGRGLGRGPVSGRGGGRAGGRAPRRRRRRARGVGAGRPRARRRGRGRPGDPGQRMTDDQSEAQRVQGNARERNLRWGSRTIARASVAARRVRPGSSPRPRYHARWDGTVPRQGRGGCAPSGSERILTSQLGTYRKFPIVNQPYPTQGAHGGGCRDPTATREGCPPRRYCASPPARRS